MSAYTPLRHLPLEAGYKAGDVLVVFGELFSRGYANGIVDEAHKAGLTIIRSTVGRRDSENQLRALTPEELGLQPKHFINIPLEAGFDLQPSQNGSGPSPVDQMKNIKLSQWQDAKLDWEMIEESRKAGRERFRKNLTAYIAQLQSLIPKGANVIFLHTMAGGVPRAKIILALMNWVFKGTGDRHLASETFWNSELGRLCALSFDDVTADTFSDLIELSSPLRHAIETSGGTTRYLAYGYHGTEVMMKGAMSWQSYAPYVQGWAKMKLEGYAEKAWSQGIKATVYNCPEILTNSSSIFVGVEVPLYAWIGALQRKAQISKKIVQTLSSCADLIKPEHSLEDLTKFTDQTLTSAALMRHSRFAGWPQHNGKEQMETLIHASDALKAMHKDTKNLITFPLSEEIFRATGWIMFRDSWNLQAPVLWLGHDILTEVLAQDHGDHAAQMSHAGHTDHADQI